jgi:hypothetical protein
MKNTLRTFPDKDAYYEEGVAACDIIKEMQSWKRMFEQELRDKLAFQEECHKLPDTDDRSLASYEYGEMKLIRKILGDYEPNNACPMSSCDDNIFSWACRHNIHHGHCKKHKSEKELDRISSVKKEPKK